MVDEINKEKLYKYPIWDYINFHYTRQCPKYNSSTNTFSQLFRYVLDSMYLPSYISEDSSDDDEGDNDSNN